MERLNLGITFLGEKNSVFKPIILRFKIDLASYHNLEGVWVNTIYGELLPISPFSNLSRCLAAKRVECFLTVYVLVWTQIKVRILNADFQDMFALDGKLGKYDLPPSFICFLC